MDSIITKKNILLLTTDVGFGGAEKTFSMLSVDLNKYHNVHVVFFNLSKEPVYPIGGEIINLETPPSLNFIQYIFNTLNRIKKIKKIKKELRITESISFLEGADYLNILSKYQERIILCIVGSKIFDKNIKGFMRLIRLKILIPLLYKRADFLVSNCLGLKNELITEFGINNKKIQVIFNYLELNKINKYSKCPVAENLKSIFNYTTLVTHSRLSIEKGIKFQILLLKNLIEEGIIIKLLIVGDGPHKEELKTYCNKLDLNYTDVNDIGYNFENIHVVFWGYNSNPFNIIKNSKIYICTSFSEGMSNSIVEAMACQIPVLTTDCPYGPREIIIPEDYYSNNDLNEYPIYSDSGILLPVIKNLNDLAAIKLWVDTIKNVLDNPKLQSDLANNALKRIEHFSYKNNINAWLNVIN